MTWLTSRQQQRTRSGHDRRLKLDSASAAQRGCRFKIRGWSRRPFVIAQRTSLHFHPTNLI